MIREKITSRLSGHRKWKKFIDVMLVAYEVLINTIDDTIVIGMASIGVY